MFTLLASSLQDRGSPLDQLFDADQTLGVYFIRGVPAGLECVQNVWAQHCFYIACLNRVQACFQNKRQLHELSLQSTFHRNTRRGSNKHPKSFLSAPRHDEVLRSHP